MALCVCRAATSALTSFRLYSKHPHPAATLYHRLALVPFLDSGAWDYCITQAFDVFFRSSLVFSLLPATEHGWGERAISRLWGVLRVFAPTAPTSGAGFYAFLAALLHSLLTAAFVLGFFLLVAPLA